METDQTEHSSRRWVLWGMIIVMIAMMIIAIFGLLRGPKVQYRDGTPVTSASVQLACFSADNADVNGGAQLTVRTDPFWGYIMRPLPASCAYVAAMVAHDSDTTGSPARWHSYETNWPQGHFELEATADGVIDITRDAILTVYDVDVSMAWEPVETQYMGQLQNGFVSASQYLYTLTNGQVAFGRVTVRSDGDGWEDADFRILAANDLRPSAYVGGIVANEVQYVANPAAGTESDTQLPIEIDFRPAAIFLGRYWDGNIRSEAVKGNWSADDAFRTMVHEWAHYGLFLQDEYVFDATAGQTGYCICSEIADESFNSGECYGIAVENAASAMALHYNVDHFWHPGDVAIALQQGTKLNLSPEQIEQMTPERVADALFAASSLCPATNQWRTYQETDWESLSNDKLFALAGMPSLIMDADPFMQPVPGLPTSLAEMLIGINQFDQNVVSGGNSPEMTVTASPKAQPPSFVHIYTLSDVDRDGLATHIVHQGSLVVAPDADTNWGSLALFGVNDGDQRYVSADNYGDGTRMVADAALSNNAELSIVDWNATVDVVYTQIDGNLNEMTINLTDAEPLQSAPIVQLCLPDNNVGCTATEWRQTMTEQNGVWTATFNPLAGNDEFPLYWLMQIEAPGHGRIIRWIMDGGGVGPGVHEPGGAPFLPDGSGSGTDMPVTVSVGLKPGTVPAQNTNCSRVISMPTAKFDALTLDALSAELQKQLNSKPLHLVGVPLDVDILLPAKNGDCTSDLADANSDYVVRLTFFYDDRALPDGAGQLRIVHYDPKSGIFSETTEPADITDPDSEREIIQPVDVNRVDCDCDDDRADVVKNDRLVPRDYNADEPEIHTIQSGWIDDAGVYLLIWTEQ